MERKYEIVIDHSGAIKNLKELDRQFDKTEQASEGLDKSAKKQKGTVSGLGSEVRSTAARYAGWGAAIAGVTTVIGGSLKQFATYEKSLAEVNTLLDDTQSIDKYSRSIRELSNQFGVDQSEQAKAMYQVISAGAGSAAEATEILTQANKLALGGVTDIDTAADGLTSIINAYGLEASKASEISDQMFATMRAGKTTIGEISANVAKVTPLAAQMGVEFAEVAAGVATLTASGVKTSEAMTGLNGVIKAVLKPTKEAADTANDLGIQFDSAALKSKGLAGFIEDVAEKTGGSEEKMALLFGEIEGLKSVMQLGGKQAETFAENIEKISTSAGETDRAVSAMSDTLSQDLKILQANVRDLGISFGEDLSPAMRVAVQGLTSLVQNADVAIPLITGLLVATTAGSSIGAMGLSAVAAGARIATLSGSILTAQGRMVALSGVAAGLRGALAFLGGPAGIAILAGSALLAFGKSSKRSSTDVIALREEVDRLTQSQSELANSTIQTSLEQTAVAVNELEAELKDLNDRQELSNSLGDEYGEDLTPRIKRVSEALELHKEKSEALNKQLQGLNKTTSDFSDNTDEVTGSLDVVVDKADDVSDELRQMREEYERLLSEANQTAEGMIEGQSKVDDSVTASRDHQINIFGDIGSAWDDLQEGNVRSALNSFENIADNWEDMLKKMVVSWGLSGIGGFLSGEGFGGFTLDAFLGGAGGKSGGDLGSKLLGLGGKKITESLFGSAPTASEAAAMASEFEAARIAAGLGGVGSGAAVISNVGGGVSALAGATGGVPAAVLGSGGGQAVVVGSQAAPAAQIAPAASSQGGFSLAGFDPVSLAIFAGIGLLSQSGGRSASEIANAELGALSSGERGVYNPSVVTGNTDRLGVLNEDITFFRDPDSNLDRAAEILQGEMGYDRSFSFGDGFLKVESERLDAFAQADVILQQTADSIIRADAEWEHFRAALEDGSLSSATTVADAFAVGFGRTGESAKIAFKKIKDVVVEWEEHGGMNADQFAKSVADAFNIGVDEARRFLDQTGLVQEDFARGFNTSITDVSRNIVKEFNNSIKSVQNFGKKTKQELSSLPDAAAQAGAGIASSITNQLSTLDGALSSVNLGTANVQVNNIPSAQVSPPQLNVGTPYVQKDGLAVIHKGEAVLTADENKSRYDFNDMMSSLVGEIRALNSRIDLVMAGSVN